VDGLTDLFAGKDSSTASMEGKVVLRSPEYEAVQKAVLEAITNAKAKSPGQRVLLIVDGIDLLPAATGQDVEALLDVVASWREVSCACYSAQLYANSSHILTSLQHAYSTIITALADMSLIQSHKTPLERNHVAFATSMAHQARAVISLRLLSTGVAKDVSGVLRITKGPEVDDDDGQTADEKELLFYIGGDGNVKVFERGASS
jgi:elongator complex protein 6